MENLCFFGEVMPSLSVFDFDFVDPVDLMKFIFKKVEKLGLDVLLISGIVGKN